MGISPRRRAHDLAYLPPTAGSARFSARPRSTEPRKTLSNATESSYLYRPTYPHLKPAQNGAYGRLGHIAPGSPLPRPRSGDTAPGAADRTFYRREGDRNPEHGSGPRRSDPQVRAQRHETPPGHANTRGEVRDTPGARGGRCHAKRRGGEKCGTPNAVRFSPSAVRSETSNSTLHYSVTLGTIFLSRISLSDGIDHMGW